MLFLLVLLRLLLFVGALLGIAFSSFFWTEPETGEWWLS